MQETLARPNMATGRFQSFRALQQRVVYLWEHSPLALPEIAEDCRIKPQVVSRILRKHYQEES